MVDEGRRGIPVAVGGEHRRLRRLVHSHYVTLQLIRRRSCGVGQDEEDDGGGGGHGGDGGGGHGGGGAEAECKGGGVLAPTNAGGVHDYLRGVRGDNWDYLI